MGSSSLNFDSLWVTAYHFHKSVQVFFLLSVVQLISAVSQITFHFHILSLFIQVSQKKKFKITNFLFHSAMKKIHFLSLMHSKICISSSWFPNGYLDEVGFFNTIECFDKCLQKILLPLFSDRCRSSSKTMLFLPPSPVICYTISKMTIISVLFVFLLFVTIQCIDAGKVKCSRWSGLCLEKTTFLKYNL